jgi:hypothetical protein
MGKIFGAYCAVNVGFYRRNGMAAKRVYFCAPAKGEDYRRA